MSPVVGLLSVYVHSVSSHLLTFARAGGGGSSSGGDGAGFIFYVIGYMPMHFLGSLIRKFKKKHENLGVIAQVVGWGIAIIYATFFVFVAGFIGSLIFIVALLGMGAGMYGWFGKLKQSKATKQALEKASQADSSTWNEEAIIEFTKSLFNRYQQDWSSFNTESMKSYMTPTYQYHVALMIYALQLMGRQNIIEEITIFKVQVVDLSDSTNNAQDTVIVGIEASVKDTLIDSISGKTLFTDSSTFTEFWRLHRSGNTWLLDGIQQATAEKWVHNDSLENFAIQQGYYYCLDWGWLLLPSRGQIFKNGQFGVADINNHIIGMHGQCLVQLYSYKPNVDTYTNNSLLSNNYHNQNKFYIISQTYVPKSYGNIVVKKKSLKNIFTSIGELQKISTEWVDFNNKYDVYATNAELATSLELLNPKFMEKLEGLPFEVNLEVVDNIIYLYANQKDGASTAEDYQVMLSVLNDAFKEMKL